MHRTRNRSTSRSSLGRNLQSNDFFRRPGAFNRKALYIMSIANLIPSSDRNTESSKKMDGIWNRYNLKSTRRIYTLGVLKCSEKFKLLDLPWYISICAPFVVLETSKRNSISCHVFWIMSRVTVSMADVIQSCRCWIFLIFSAYTMFLT